MATYAIGDIQGCYRSLVDLLDTIKFNPNIDNLWFTGDLVNRGPQSLEVLRYVKSLGNRAITVLGNHDLHLLAVAAGVDKIKHKDTLDSILHAPDKEDLLTWLRHRPLLHYDPLLNFMLIHAGLPPQWTVERACAYASEIESLLQTGDYLKFFSHMYGNIPNRWSDNLSGYDRWRLISNCFTRMRYCDLDGTLDFHHKGEPGTQPTGFFPWFQHPDRQHKNTRILFGHWSTLPSAQYNNVYSLDSGCIWGRQLTALKLDDPPVWIRIDCSP